MPLDNAIFAGPLKDPFEFVLKEDIKMEAGIFSPCAEVAGRIAVEEGQGIDEGELLMEVEQNKTINSLLMEELK